MSNPDFFMALKRYLLIRRWWNIYFAKLTQILILSFALIKMVDCNIFLNNFFSSLTDGCKSMKFFFCKNKWEKVFKSGLSKFCGRGPLKNLKGYGPYPFRSYPLNFFKAVFQKVYLVHSWILCHKCNSVQI